MEDTAELEAAPHSEADERVRAEPEAPRRKQRVPRPAEHDPAPDVAADGLGQSRSPRVEHGADGLAGIKLAYNDNYNGVLDDEFGLIYINSGLYYLSRSD